MKHKKQISLPKSKQLEVTSVKKLDEKLEHTIKILDTITHAPALNGGFDKLVGNVAKIQESQKVMGEKVDQIHRVIYDPDDGLFARVKTMENIQHKIEEISTIEKDIVLMKERQNSDRIASDKVANENDDRDKEITKLNDEVKELAKFKTKVGGIVKWFLVTSLGGAITLLVKLFIETFAK